MTSNHRPRRVAVAAVLAAAAGLALGPAPQGFAAQPPNVVAFDPQPDPPGRLAIIIHYNQPVDPDALPRKR